MGRSAKSWMAVGAIGTWIAAGCSGTAAPGPDAGPHLDAGSTVDAGPIPDGGATTTIAAAITGNVTTPITVVGVVTALAGVPMDYPTWYIEDPAGGPNSGIAIFCDPLGTCPLAKSNGAPPQGTLVAITGAISTYHGQRQITPTAQAVLRTNFAFPPIPVVTAADLSPTGTSAYRGVFVKYDATKLTVDSVTPPALWDSQCGTAYPDGGLPQCSGCTPPTYAGFQANDGAGHELYIEAPFFNTDPLQSSPECLTQTGVTSVAVGMTFTSIQGILDLDPYGAVQYLAPMQPSDYVTP